MSVFMTHNCTELTAVCLDLSFHVLWNQPLCHLLDHPITTAYFSGSCVPPAYVGSLQVPCPRIGSSLWALHRFQKPFAPPWLFHSVSYDLVNVTQHLSSLFPHLKNKWDWQFMENKQNIHKASRKVPNIVSLNSGSYSCELVVTTYDADMSGKKKPP